MPEFMLHEIVVSSSSNFFFRNGFIKKISLYVTLFHLFTGYGRQDYEDISHPIPQNSDFDGV